MSLHALILQGSIDLSECWAVVAIIISLNDLDAAIAKLGTVGRQGTKSRRMITELDKGKVVGIAIRTDVVAMHDGDIADLAKGAEDSTNSRIVDFCREISNKDRTTLDVVTLHKDLVGFDGSNRSSEGRNSWSSRSDSGRCCLWNLLQVIDLTISESVDGLFTSIKEDEFDEETLVSKVVVLMNALNTAELLHELAGFVDGNRKTLLVVQEVVDCGISAITEG